MASRSNQKGKKKKTDKAEETRLQSEISLLLILAACILLFISNFGVGGVVGEAVSGVCFGLFGLLSYIFPILFFVAALFFVSNRGNRIAMIKLIAAVFFFLFFALFIELVMVGNLHTTILGTYTYAAETKNGGGIVGGALSIWLIEAFGLIGTYVIDIILLIICMVLITEKSFFGGIKKGSQKIYEEAKEQQEQAKKRRRDRKVAGVVADTTLRPAEKGSEQPEETKEETHAWSPKKAEEPVAEETKTEEDSPYKERWKHAVATIQEEEQQETGEEKGKSSGRKTRQSQEEIQEDIVSIEKEIQETEAEEKDYVFPPLSFLKRGSGAKGDSARHLQETADKLQQTLKNFGVNVTITDVSCGPSVTRYEMQPEMGVKVSRIVNLADDIKLNLAAADIRIEAPIPGKAAIGIEVPNKENVMVRFRDIVESSEFQTHKSNICFTVGKNIAGQIVVADIAKMPHLLIAGATGSGKSVCINTIIMSILYHANPEDVKLILIDPKVVELSTYNGIPHLFIPVVTDPKKAAGALHWAVSEMTERYQKFAEYQVRDLKSYNEKVASIAEIEDETKPTKLPQIVIIVDGLADLMMVAPGDVEDAICRLAQLARAAGIHLIIATQRPSVDVITGLIKANMPSRIAFSVSSGVDSRTILDMNGAEKLLGNGDMLFYPQGYSKPLRVQAPFVSDQEIESVVDFMKKQSNGTYNKELEEKMSSTVTEGSGGSFGGNERDAYFVDAGRFVIDKDKGSIGMLQRWFKIGFNRAARIMDQLEEAGVVGPEEGTKPRKILMTPDEFEAYVEECV